MRQIENQFNEDNFPSSFNALDTVRQLLSSVQSEVQSIEMLTDGKLTGDQLLDASLEEIADAANSAIARLDAIVVLNAKPIEYGFDHDSPSVHDNPQRLPERPSDDF